MMHRRAFLGALAAPLFAGPSPVCPASDDQHPYDLRRTVIERKRASVMTRTDWRILHAAYQNWRTLPVNDKRSLESQAALHQATCTGSAMHADIHQSWWFLPWHRGFVYFHERILGSFSSQRVDFRLPAWDWETVPCVPAPYQAVVSTGTPFGTSRAHDREIIAAGLSHCDIHAWLLSGGFADFCGSSETQGGSAPSGPHNAVHLQIGGNMGSSATSACDPLFYLHHANIDRFWCLWRNQYAKLNDDHAFDPPQDWLNHSFTFVDENGCNVVVRVADLLDERELGYFYEEPQDYHLVRVRPFDVNVDAAGLLTLPLRLTNALFSFLSKLKLSGWVSDLLHPNRFLGDAAIILKQLMSLSGSIPIPELKAGRYYSIGIAAPENPNPVDPAQVTVLGGVGDFTGAGEGSGAALASLCFQPETLINFLAQSENPFSIALYYSPMNDDGTSTIWKRIRPPSNFGLRLSIPPEWLSGF